ncbi:hypothetical protein KIW84_055134 [Lathyrus oleraceus]|uniref:DUF7745 domain-containing protein n=1 Tax=Pisum sativum TaxID=3888 RepID=A0A9D4WXX5_PEA|nr:hypothetical protein KIW84_055134 [Pisum sativum]
MDYGRRNTKKYSFRCPDLKELRNLASFVLDPLDFKRHGKLLSILFTDLVPTLEEYSHLLGIPISSRVPFSGLEEIPRSNLIIVAHHLKKVEIEAHWVKKGGLFGLPSDFFIKEANVFAQSGSVDAFEAISALLIYGLALFPNIDGFVDVNAIRLFLIGNHVATLLGDMYFSLHIRNSKGGGTIVCCIPLLYKWFISHLPQTPTFVENKQCLRLDIIDCYGEFSNVPLIGTQGGINYNPVLARRQLGFPLRDKPNNTLLEGLFYQEERALELKMPYPCERPVSMVVVEPLTLPNQDVEELQDALPKMKQEKDMREECFHALSKKHEELQLESKDKDALIELLED